MELIKKKLWKNSVGTYALAHAITDFVSFLSFNFRRALIGLFKRFKFLWRNLFCPAYEKKWIWVFLSRTCIVPLAFRGNFWLILRILRAVGKNVRADKHHQYTPHRRRALFALAEWLVQKWLAWTVHFRAVDDTKSCVKSFIWFLYSIY